MWKNIYFSQRGYYTPSIIIKKKKAIKSVFLPNELEK